MELTQKERQSRGIDALGTALAALVDERMRASVPEGRPWVELYEAKESARRRHPFRVDRNDPRLMLRIMRHERGVFSDIDATQRAWLDELIQASNRAAHTTTLGERQVDRALETMEFLAESLGLEGAQSTLVELRLLGDGNGVSPASAAVPDGSGHVVPQLEDRSMGTEPAARDAAEVSAAVQAQRVPIDECPRGVAVLSARVGALDVRADLYESLNYALVHNGAKPVMALQTMNNGADVVSDLEVTLTLDLPDGVASSRLAVPLDVRIGDVGPGEIVSVPSSSLEWRLSPGAFLELDEAALAVGTLEVSRAGVTHRDERPIRVLPADEWWARTTEDSLVAFVRPNASAIGELLQRASEILRSRTGNPSLDGYQTGPDRVHRIAEAVYEAMAALDITYVEPPASFEGTGQRIRSHEEVLQQRIGTCLDLACTYAAALEQAGLAPVLVVTRNHAFCGYLTEDTQLPEAVVGRQGAIITVADSGSFDAVETTALCAGDRKRSFDNARGEVRRWWTREIEEIRALVDVRAAHRWIRPLPSIRRDGDVRVVESVHIVEAPDRRMPATYPHEAPRIEDAPARVARWKRSLLDMSYANPLLRLKHGSTSTLHVPSGAVGMLEDLIAAGTRLDLIPNDQVTRLHALEGSRTAAEADPEALRAELMEGHRVFVAHTKTEYPRRLKALQRRGTTAREETGTDSLYLGLGTLCWAEGARAGEAPLFLVPVKLAGGRGSTPFRLELDDTREIEPNYCLQEKLRASYGIEIPELVDPGEDTSGIALDAALRSIRSRLLYQKALEFHVEETAHLATFQFSTLGMWRDLNQNWESLVSRPAVTHLVESAGKPFDDGITEPEPDDRAEATTYLPIPADGSQIKAIRWAAAGKSFILEGPPGTGKSQTITNLIAHLIAEGKKVLFVAEKQAALDVVKRRLDTVGLGTFSLDVHGSKQTVKAVREQLQDAFEVSAGSDASWESLRSAYRNAVEYLSHYPRHLHEEGPVGLSAWDARQVLQNLRATAPEDVPTFTVPREAVMGTLSLSEVYDLAGELDSGLEALGVEPADSPWRLAGPLTAGTDLDRARVRTALETLEAVEHAIEEQPVRRIAAHAETADQFAAVSRWLDAVSWGRGRNPADASRLVTAEWRAQARDAVLAVDQCRASYASVLHGLRPEILERDLAALVVRSEAADKKWFGKKKARQAVTDEIRPFLRGDFAPDPRVLTQMLRGLATARHTLSSLVPYMQAFPGLNVPPTFNPFRDGDVDALHHQLDGWEVSAAVAWTIPSTAEMEEAARQILEVGTAGGATIRELEPARTALCVALAATEKDIAAWARGERWAVARERARGAWQADAGGESFVQLQRWVRIRTALQRLSDLGFDDLVERVYAGEVRGAQVEPAVRLAVAREIVTERLASTGLVAFDPRRQASQVDRFVRTGGDVRERMRHELPAKIVAARTFDPRHQMGEIGELRRQIARRRGGMTIRQLMQRFAPVVTQVTPCFLMSPGSVARFLPADSVHFDVVVFDEASQIRVPEAIGAMGRAKSVVIVGDSKQMPPSSMFAAAAPTEDEEEGLTEDALPVPADMESILTEAVESNLPRLMLSWHYRSRDESLIAFSNQHYYDGRLASFPTPPDGKRLPAVHLKRVNGTWEGGSSRAARVNRAETAAVVDEVTKMLEADPGRSVGVVTFNTQQRTLILDSLEEKAETDERIATALQREVEPLFVKNLENVQGDERDVILFTLAFAKDARGKVPLNWGPLSRAGGEKRLNVAITRAKEQVTIFASFDPYELDLTSSRSEGLAHLKDYLLLARDGVERALPRRDASYDWHLADVRTRLDAAGLETRTNVGLSDFTVDLAVRAGEGEPWIAVLLDGPSWAERESVGDREGLPTAVLTQQMGWAETVRVWLPEWLRDAGDVVRTIESVAKSVTGVSGTSHSEIAASAAVPPGLDSAETVVSPDDVREPVRSIAVAAGTPSAPEGTATWTLAGQEEFVPAQDRPCHERTVLDDTGHQAAARIREQLVGVVEAEGPVLLRRLASITARRFGMSRLRGEREQQILRRLPRELVRISANGDRVAWPAALEPSSYLGFRIPGATREVEEVPYEELRNAMVAVVRGAFGMDEEEVIRETARVFGWTRVGSKVRARLESTRTAAIREGALVRHASQLRDG